MAQVQVGTTTTTIPIDAQVPTIIQNLGPGTLFVGGDSATGVSVGVGDFITAQKYGGLSAVSSDSSDVRYLEGLSYSTASSAAV